MKDQLENFFKDNKADFDYLPKESTPSWEQMEGQLDRKKAAPLRLKKYHGWWAAAALQRYGFIDWFRKRSIFPRLDLAKS